METNLKTVALAMDASRESPRVTLEFSEFELVSLAALVEEGRRVLRGKPANVMTPLMDAVAGEFMTVLGHLELLTTSE